MLKHNDKNRSKHFIEGDRIYLREVRVSDVTDDYCRWMNDPKVDRYLETRFHPHSREEIESYVSEMKEDADTVFLAILVKQGDVHIGNMKIGPANRIHLYADLSIVIGERAYWGKGFATEAIILAVEYAFSTLNLHKLEAGAYANNRGSIKAFRKADFFEEGRRKGHFFCNGSYVDWVLMGILHPSKKTICGERLRGRKIEQ